jgi:xanthine dehydrogenase YagR molybdenum-binding subunit
MIGRALSRVDGRAKVTGAARYAAEFDNPDQAYAVIVASTVGRGRITEVDASRAAALPGVLSIITHLNAPRLPYGEHRGQTDPAYGERLHVLQDDTVRFFGQPIGVVVAETLDQAEHAAAAVRISYSAERPVLRLDAPEAELLVPQVGLTPSSPVQADTSRGDAERAFERAPKRIGQRYGIAWESHNPMEPHATVASWNDGRLTLWSKSQFLVNEAAEIAAIFGMAAEDVLVICPYIGGAFGTSLRTWPHVVVAALAARQVERPVKLVLTRRQMFSMTGHRARTMQRVALGAERDGRLTAIIHEGVGETSRYEQYAERLTGIARYLYSCPNVRTRYRLLPRDVGTPNSMRAPGESSGVFALECAMDELAVELGIDPIELRIRNEPALDESSGLPFSSRSLRECYALGATRFGWARRSAAPRSMRDGRLLIGWGMAAATYPTNRSPARARARLLANGRVEVEAASSDMGPGTYTSMVQVAADAMGVPMEQATFRLGRSDYPPTPSHGGSQTMASVGSAVHAACLALREKVIGFAIHDASSPLYGAQPDAIEARDGRLMLRSDETRGETYRDIIGRRDEQVIVAQAASAAGEERRHYAMHAFGAVFAEVAVDPDLAMVRVRRIVGAYGAGRIVNPKLAHSQCTGGMVGGIGMALMEQTTLDPRDGRLVNASLADYLVPVNLDIAALEALFVDEKDEQVNPLGVKGVGEIAMVGTAPAIANAVYHATGRRVRDLPIRVEALI